MLSLYFTNVIFIFHFVNVIFILYKCYFHGFNQLTIYFSGSSADSEPMQYFVFADTNEQGREDEHQIAPADTSSPHRSDSLHRSDSPHRSDSDAVAHSDLDSATDLDHDEGNTSDIDEHSDRENQENDALPESDGSDTSEEAGIADVGDLAREWYLIQLGRVCSNEVSSDLWDFAWKHCDAISEFKANMDGKPTKFPALRKTVLKECAPALKMDYIFKDKSLPDHSEDYTFVFNRESYPKREYPFDRYELMAQITHMKVK